MISNGHDQAWALPRPFCRVDDLFNLKSEVNGGIPWFNAMEKGIQKAGKADNLNAYMVGPTTADPAQQVRAVEDLIAKKVKVIGVVPNDAKVLEPVFDRAKQAGIPIITHESPDQKGNLWDIKLIDNKEIGESHLKAL